MAVVIICRNGRARFHRPVVARDLKSSTPDDGPGRGASEPRRLPIGIGALAIAGRVIAFGLVIAGAATMPAPPQAGETPGRSP